MNMDNNTLQQLTQVYNTLLLVHTCGEDSFLMTDCMRTFATVLKNNIEKNKIQIQEE